MTRVSKKASTSIVPSAPPSFEGSFSGGRFRVIEVVGMNMEPAFYRFDHAVIDLQDTRVGSNGGIFAYRWREVNGDGISINYLCPLQDGDLSWKSQRLECRPGNDSWISHETALPEIEVIGRVVGRITKRFDHLQSLERETLRLKQAEDGAQKNGSGRWYKREQAPRGGKRRRAA